MWRRLPFRWLNYLRYVEFWTPHLTGIEVCVNSPQIERIWKIVIFTWSKQWKGGGYMWLGSARWVLFMGVPFIGIISSTVRYGCEPIVLHFHTFYPLCLGQNFIKPRTKRATEFFSFLGLARKVWVRGWNTMFWGWEWGWMTSQTAPKWNSYWLGGV